MSTIDRPHVASCRHCRIDWRSATLEGALILADWHTQQTGHGCTTSRKP